MMEQWEQELARIQESMPTPYIPHRYAVRLMPWLQHYHKVWLTLERVPDPKIRERARDELQKSMKALAACLYDWVG
jgi:hypothetical protein